MVRNGFRPSTVSPCADFELVSPTRLPLVSLLVPADLDGSVLVEGIHPKTACLPRSWQQ